MCIFIYQRPFYQSSTFKRTMKFFLILILCAICSSILAQEKKNCRIDIYLVKNYIDCWDSTTKKIIPFQVTLQDLEDTAFIKNEEIISYTLTRLRTKFQKNKRITVKFHHFRTSPSLTARIDRLQLSISGCAKQFAIICDGEIIYGGCLNNIRSSWAPPIIVAGGLGNEFSLSYYGDKAHNDPRENSKLFSCLKSSNRFRYVKKSDKE